MTESEFTGLEARMQPSGGRRARRRAETQGRIFRAGLQLFAERGFATITIEDITEMADVGKGTFFNYFRSKDHLLAAFGDMQLRKLQAALAEARMSHRPVRMVLQRALQVLVEEPGRSPELVRNLMVANFSNEMVRKKLQKNLGAGRKELTQLLDLAQQRKEIRGDVSPELLARMVQQTFFGGVVLWCLNPDRTLRKLQSDVFKVIWSSLETPGMGIGLR